MNQKTRIQSIATAVPGEAIFQKDILKQMLEILSLSGEKAETLENIYSRSGIQSRYSVLEDFRPNVKPEFFKPDSFPSTSKRMTVYKHEAYKLLSEVVRKLEFDPKEITHIVLVSCTGMTAPGLELRLIQDFGMSAQTHRFCIRFMGCYAGFNGLKTADAICRSDANAKVLLLSAELCTLHLQDSRTMNDLVAGALFSDGAAGFLLTADNSPKQNHIAEINGFYTTLIPEGEKDMSWDIADSGFEMNLGKRVPVWLKQKLPTVKAECIYSLGLENKNPIYAIHPGGVKILEAFSNAFNLETNSLAPSFDALSRYGNMSSATIFFVLQEILLSKDVPSGTDIFAAGFGPGLVMESAALKVLGQ